MEVRTKKCDDDSLPDDRKTTSPIGHKKQAKKRQVPVCKGEHEIEIERARGGLGLDHHK